MLESVTVSPSLLLTSVVASFQATAAETPEVYLLVTVWLTMNKIWLSNLKPQIESQQESSAKLTNQRVIYAFTSSPFSFHVCHVLPIPSSSIVILVFYLFSTGISEQHVWKLWVWIQSTGLTLPLRVTPMNNPLTLITSTVAGLHFCCADSYTRSSANFLIFFSESQNASPLDAELRPDFNGKWPFKVIQGHRFRRQWRATKGLNSTI